jgi:hypothetical protein
MPMRPILTVNALSRRADADSRNVFRKRKALHVSIPLLPRLVSQSNNICFCKYYIANRNEKQYNNQKIERKDNRNASNSIVNVGGLCYNKVERILILPTRRE